MYTMTVIGSISDSPFTHPASITTLVLIFVWLPLLLLAAKRITQCVEPEKMVFWMFSLVVFPLVGAIVALVVLREKK